MFERFVRALAPVCLAFAAAGAHAQAWPAKPVRIVVAFSPGGSTDLVVRAMSDRLSQELGQPVVVENRAGANGNVAAEYVVKQPADVTWCSRRLTRLPRARTSTSSPSIR